MKVYLIKDVIEALEPLQHFISKLKSLSMDTSLQCLNKFKF